jgi:hypothetical protein
MIFLVNFIVSFSPGISASAHFGGGIVGFILGTLLHVQRSANGFRRMAALALAIALPILCVAAVAEKMRSDERWQLLAALDKAHDRRASPKGPGD